jgi:alpha-tubulin suppressor-like RCC1 family protein
LFLVGCGESGGESGNKSEKNESVSDPVLSSAKDITSFSFSFDANYGIYKETVIDESKSEINVTIHYYLTTPRRATNPTPIVTHTGVDYSPKGAISTFGTAVTYTVTAEDGTTKDYQALVRRAVGVGDEGTLLTALFAAINHDSDVTQIDVLIAGDINLTYPHTIPSEWSSKGIVIKNNSANPSVTIRGLSIEEGGATLGEGVILEALPPPPPPPPPQSVHIKAIAAGGYHSFAIADDGKVYATGDNGRYQLGLGDKINRYTFTPVPLLEGKNIVAIAAGLDHSLALSTDGKVYATGRNDHGQLGLGNEVNQSVFIPVTLLSDKNITAIAAGGYHSIALDSDGKVYAAGRNVYGELGLGNSGDETNRNTFELVASLNGKNITAISAGYCSSRALDSDGKVYAAGHNYLCQLGLLEGGCGWNAVVDVFTRPTSGLTDSENIVAIAAGDDHSLALDSDGKVYAVGGSEFGQLGLNSDWAIKFPFELAISLNGKNITAIAAGALHSLALDSDGKVYATGQNGGKLGLGDVTLRKAFTHVTLLNGKNIVAIAAGNVHSLALDSDGKVYATGVNGSGQLGLIDNANRNTFTPTVFNEQ